MCLVIVILGLVIRMVFFLILPTRAGGRGQGEEAGGVVCYLEDFLIRNGFGACCWDRVLSCSLSSGAVLFIILPALEGEASRGATGNGVAYLAILTVGPVIPTVLFRILPAGEGLGRVREEQICGLLFGQCFFLVLAEEGRMFFKFSRGQWQAWILC